MIDRLVEAYSAAHHRLLFFDYDGVLAPIVARPEMAVPSEEVVALLGELSIQPNTAVVVVSGRDNTTLENWLGGLNIDMSAEHGHFSRIDEVWREEAEIDLSWREDVESAMSELVVQYPGSHIETKPASLVWHYREVEAEVDEEAAKQKISLAASGRADVMSGKCVVDVRAPGADKGKAVRRWYDAGNWDFVLCIGDDVTDEAMYTALPKSAWTVKVGSGETNAEYQLDTQTEVIDLLKQITER